MYYCQKIFRRHLYNKKILLSYICLTICKKYIQKGHFYIHIFLLCLITSILFSPIFISCRCVILGMELNLTSNKYQKDLQTSNWLINKHWYLCYILSWFRYSIQIFPPPAPWLWMIVISNIYSRLLILQVKGQKFCLL